MSARLCRMHKSNIFIFLAISAYAYVLFLCLQYLHNLYNNVFYHLYFSPASHNQHNEYIFLHIGKSQFQKSSRKNTEISGFSRCYFCVDCVHRFHAVLSLLGFLVLFTILYGTIITISFSMIMIIFYQHPTISTANIFFSI